MVKKKKFMAYLAIVLLLILSMIMTACGGPDATKKDAAQTGKTIEITDVTGQKVTLKKPAERVVVQLSASGGAFLTMAALQGKDVAKTIVGMDPYLSKLRTDMWDRYKADVPELEKIPLIGNVNDKTFDVEKVISLNPDVIFMPLFFKEQYEADYKPKSMQLVFLLSISITMLKSLRITKNLSKLSVKLWVKKSVLQKSVSSTLIA